MRRIILIIFIIGLLFTASCGNIEAGKNGEYKKCTAICSSVLDDDYVTLELCRQECEKEFLKEN